MPLLPSCVDRTYFHEFHSQAVVPRAKGEAEQRPSAAFTSRVPCKAVPLWHSWMSLLPPTPATPQGARQVHSPMATNSGRVTGQLVRFTWVLFCVMEIILLHLRVCKIIYRK